MESYSCQDQKLARNHISSRGKQHFQLEGLFSLPSQKEREVEDPMIVDQLRTHIVKRYVRVQRHVDTNRKGSEFPSDRKVKDDLRRFHVCLVKELQSEVEALKARVVKLQSHNVHLELQNKQLDRTCQQRNLAF